MDSTIHEPHSRITIDGIGVPTPMSVDNNNIISTPAEGVPIITETSVYTTYNTKQNKREVAAKPEFQQIIYLHSRRFYAFLVPKKDKYGRDRICLLESNDYLDGYFIIAYSYLRPGTNDPKPIFTAFKDYLEAYHWLESLSLEQLVNFEVILTNKSHQPSKQKPHFDVDIHFDDNPDDNKGKYTIEELGTAMMIMLPTVIEDTMLHFNVPYDRRRHLLISNSSTNDKQSYHVIIRGYCHKDHIEAKAFYELVKSRLPPYLQPYLDRAVYGPKQQFRLLGNHKLGKTNVKIMDERLTLWRPEHTSDRGTDASMLKLVTFEEFLVSYTPGCIELPSFINESTALKSVKKPIVSVDLSLYEDTIRSMYESSQFKDSGPIRDFSNGNVNITNNRRFKCPICDKPHEHENPYLYVVNGSLFWDCRRHDKTKKSKYIGKINGFTQSITPIPLIDTGSEVSDCCEFMGVYCMKHGEDCPNINNQQQIPISDTPCDLIKLDRDENYEIQQQRVQTIPIINGVIPQGNNLIKSSQVMGHSSEAATTKGNYNIYDNTSVPEVAASLLRPTDCDDRKLQQNVHENVNETASNNCINNIGTGKFLINPSQSMGQLNFPTPSTQTSTLNQQNNCINNIVTGKFLINPSQSVGQIQQQNLFINPSQVDPNTWAAATTKGNYNIYDNTSVAASLLRPSTKDDLVIKNQEHVYITETASNKLTAHSLQEKILINPSQSMGQLNFLTPTNQISTLNHANNGNYNINTGKFLINPSQSMGQIKFPTPPTQTSTLNHANNGNNNIVNGKFLINPSQSVGQTLHYNTNSINLSQLVGHASEAATTKGNYNSYDNTSVAASTVGPTNKDKLEYFIKYHTTTDFNSSISLHDFVETFKKYHASNSLEYTYKNDDCVSRDIASINPSMKTRRKQVKGIQSQYIVGYKFHNLDFMNVRQDVTRTIDVTQMLPIVAKKADIKNAETQLNNATRKNEKRNKIATRKEWYDSQSIPRLNGTHQLDMRNRMARMEEILREANNPPTDHYLMFMKAPCAIGKTDLIRDVLRTASSYLIVVGRILLGRKLEDDLLINVTKQMPDGSLKEEWIKETSFYSDIEGKVIRVNKVICTIDSLYRVEGNFEYLILDECSYALNQLVNGSKNKRDNACALIERIKRTKKVIVADAYLQQSTVDMIDRIRNRQDKIMYENHYPKHSEKTINEIDSCGIYYAIIEAAVAARVKQCIPAGSKELANSIATNMQDEFGCKIYREDQLPDVNETAYKVKIYTGDDKKGGNPTKEWHLFDCIIFTSVLEAGNSYTDSHFDECNAFFTANSCGPESAAQMILRCRNYTSGNINVLVAGGYKDKYHIPSNIETSDQFKEYIRQHIVDYRDDIRDGIRLSYIDGIDLTHEYFDLWCDVKYREHMGKKNYSDNFMKLCKSQGMEYGSYIDEEEYKSLTGLLDFEDADEKVEEGDEDYFGYKMQGVCRRIKTAKNKNRITECNNISEIYDISAEDSERIKRDGNASSGDKLARKKFELKKRYGIHNITPEFIHKVLDKSKIHTNVTAFKDLSGDLDERQRHVIKERIANDMKAVEVPITTRDDCLNKVMSFSQNETPSSDELLKAEELYNKINKTPHVVDRIDTTDRIKRYLSNLYAVNILGVFDFKRWLRTEADSVNKIQFPTIDLRSFISRLESLKHYVNDNYKDLQFYPNFEIISTLNIKDITVTDKLDKKEDLTLSTIRSFINKTLEPFDMKFNISNNRLGYYLKSKWQLDQDGYVRPLTFDPEKQPALSKLPDKNVVVDVKSIHVHKIQDSTASLPILSNTFGVQEIKCVNILRPRIYDNTKREYIECDMHSATNANNANIIHTPPIGACVNNNSFSEIVHTPPIGVCVNNNKIVQTQAVIPSKIVVPVPVQRRIQAVPIINNNLALAKLAQ